MNQYPYLANFDRTLEYMKKKNFWELLVMINGALVLVSLRQILDKFVFRPIGVYLGLKSNRKPVLNRSLEAAYQKKRSWSHNEILGLSKQLDTTESEVEAWLKLRKAQDKPTILEKFSESCWKSLYHTIYTFVGFAVFYDEAWVWNLKECWKDYFNLTTIGDDVWWYFALYFSNACAQLINLVSIDTRRKDFLLMYVHHLAILMVIIFTWISNLSRIVLFASFTVDVCDIFIEAAKVAKYLGHEKSAAFLFLVFMVTWLVGRFGLFPWFIISFVRDIPELWTTTPGFYLYYIPISGLCTLVALNCIWTYFIVRIATNYFATGVGRDARSDSDTDDQMTCGGEVPL